MSIVVIRYAAALLELLDRWRRDAWRWFEEVVLRRTLSTEFRSYLTETFDVATVAEIAADIALTRSFGDKSPAVVRSEAISRLYQMVVSLEGRARQPAGTQITASIVVPVHNNVAHTLTCLASILRQRTHHPYEIIVGDDASSDQTQLLIGSLAAPVVYRRRRQNIGYLRNCNASAREARGRYVVLLNNDTVVLPGWLDALIDLMEADPTVGLAGSKLLLTNGRLQEAGGIAWNNASTVNYGRDNDPQLPPFNYVKDVDWCAAASIAVRADLWRDLGGFDERYAPAYFEDTDLAFRIREAGLRTVYQPKSVVIHHEAVTHGRDVTQGPRRHLVENRKLFYQHWAEVLAVEQLPEGQHLFLARDRSQNRPHVLVIDRGVPTAQGGNDARVLFDLMCACARRGFQLSLWPQTIESEGIDALQQRGIEVLAGPRCGRSLHRWLAENGHYLDYVLLGRTQLDAATFAKSGLLSRVKILRLGHDEQHLLQAAHRRTKTAL